MVVGLKQSVAYQLKSKSFWFAITIITECLRATGNSLELNNVSCPQTQTEKSQNAIHHQHLRRRAKQTSCRMWHIQTYFRVVHYATSDIIVIVLPQQAIDIIGI